MTSNLIFFNTLLRLVIYTLEDFMNLVLFSLLIEIITCFLKRFFVIIFSLGLGLPILLMILWMLSILFTYSLGKVFLIFRISLILDYKAWAYDFPISFLSVGLILFLKNLDISLTSLEVFMGIREDNFVKRASLLVNLSPLVVLLVLWIFRVNLDETCCLKVLLSLLVTSKFYFDL